MHTLVYLSIGEGDHVDELRFAVLTAARHRRDDADWEIVIYADRTAPFDELPAEIRVVDEETTAEWRGGHDYVYRSKILALADALRRPGVQGAVIVDGDTYFKKTPARLFERVRPGTSLMHVREGRPAPPEVAGLRRVLSQGDLVDLEGRPWRLAPDEVLYNSGVVGLHADDAHLCDEALHLTDQLLASGFAEHSHIAEMLALGSCLSRRSNLRESHDVIAHYWPTELRHPFREKLRQVWSETGIARDERLRRLWAERPKEGTKRRAKFLIRRAAWKVHLEL